MRVVLPWSTWAITATFRSRLGSREGFGEVEDAAAAALERAAEKARESDAPRGESKKERRVGDGEEEWVGEERDLRAEDQRDRINGPAIIPPHTRSERNGCTACPWIRLTLFGQS